MRFLISRLSSLGDVVCSLPAASALKSAFPDSHLTWVVDPRFAAVVHSCEAVDEVVERKVKLTPSTWPLLEGTFDAALDLQGLLKSAIVVGRAKSKVKLAYHWQREGAQMFARPVLPDPSSFHIVDQYVDVARAAGGSADKAEFRLVPSEPDLAAVMRKLSDAGVSRFVVFNAGAAWASKRWPEENFASVARKVAEQGYQVVLIGSKSENEKASAAAIAEQAGAGVISFVGSTSIGELIALLSLAKAHVGGDTGSTHIAAALGTPAIGIYSITQPRRSCPYGQLDRCLYDPLSLQNISPDMVHQTLATVLS